MVEFSPHDPDLVVATGSVDLDSRLYQFDGVESPDGSGVSLIAHADSVSRLWHECFDHVNYRYL